MATVAVAMSGGVDSSVAAYLLAREGHRVIGVSMRLHRERPDAAGGCCSPDDFLDARLVASRLGIPYYVLDLSEAFERSVVAPFVAEYAAGRTPTPCVRCNTHVKFPELLARALAVGADLVATGHYARRAGAGPWDLFRGADASKDQSYFLHGIGQEDLGRTLFPVGELTKQEVRAIAREAGILSAEKPESQEICFVEAGRHAEFVEARLGRAPDPGPILDVDGRRLGTHAGIHRYTVGQRRGLGISAPRPLYVVDVRAEDRAVVVGERDQLLVDSFAIEAATWVRGSPPARQFDAAVQVRSRHAAQPCSVTLDGAGCARIVARVPVRAVSPGQAAVLYDRDRVLGGGVISARRAEPLGSGHLI